MASQPFQHFNRAPFPASSSDQTWNSMRDAFEKLQQYVIDNLPIARGKKGQPFITDIFLGYTASSPPSGAPSGAQTYSDARYWVTRQSTPNPSGPDGNSSNSQSDNYSPDYGSDGTLTDNLTVQNDPMNDAGIRPYALTATNLAELPGDYQDGTQNSHTGSHLIPDNSIVLCVGLLSGNDPTQRAYVFYCQPPSAQFLITATATTPGCYKGSTFQPNRSAKLDFTQSTAFTASQLGSALSDSVYLINESEMFRSASEPQQWDISYILNQGNQPLVHGKFHSIAKDGKPVYTFFATALENCGQ